jgi:predicted PurR-regulated permease PerM
MAHTPSHPAVTVNPTLRNAAFAIALLAPLLAIWLHLTAALLSGLLIYVLVHGLAPLLERHLSNRSARLVAVAVLSVLIIALITLLSFGVAAFLHSNAGSLPALMQKMAEILESSRAWLPHWIVSYLPADSREMQNQVAEWLRTHAGSLQKIGTESLRGLAHALIGMVIGALLALREVNGNEEGGPLARLLKAHAKRFATAFRQVVFAQIRIAAINAFFTGIYLLVILRFFDIQLPLAKTLVALTFFAGLIPIAGNLLSNTVITIISLSHSLLLAIASLAFLVILHKLEYFLNARIIGAHIKARAWELLMAMLTMEALFGLAGLLMAPIYYAFLKAECDERGLI